MPPRKPPKCGTPAAYNKHIRDKTPVCAACQQAWRDYSRESARLRQTARAAVATAEARAEAAEMAARAKREAPTLAAHFAYKLVLGNGGRVAA